MKKLLSAALLTAALGATVSAALANPILGPMSAPVPHVFGMSVNTVPIHNAMLNGYRSVRSFWLSKGIVR